MHTKDVKQITFRKLENNDLRTLTELIELYSIVFETEDFTLPNRQYIKSLLDKDNIIFYAALLDNIVIGGLTAYILPSVYYPSSQVYIYDLAVKVSMQRQGIGKELISALKNYCKKLKHKEIYVQADLEDQHAIDFYKATGGRSASVIHFSYDLTDDDK